MKQVSLLSASLLLIWCCNSSPEHLGGSDETRIKDQLNDIANYPTVRLGEQTWLAKNLAVTRFSNGDTLFFAKDLEAWTFASDNNIPAYAYFQFHNPQEESDFGKVFYNFYAVSDPRGLAPEGWRVPTIDDWDELLKNYRIPEGKIREIKAVDGWGSYYPGNNASGFDGQPLGRIQAGTESFDANPNAVWWTSHSIYEEEAMRIEITGEDEVIKYETFKEDGLNVRLIRI